MRMAVLMRNCVKKKRQRLTSDVSRQARALQRRPPTSSRFDHRLTQGAGARLIHHSRESLQWLEGRVDRSGHVRTGQIQAMGYASQVDDQTLAQQDAYDVVHGVWMVFVVGVAGLLLGGAGWGTRLDHHANQHWELIKQRFQYRYSWMREEASMFFKTLMKCVDNMLC